MESLSMVSHTNALIKNRETIDSPKPSFVCDY